MSGLRVRERWHARRGRIPLRAIARWLPEAPIVVEAGAHIGTDTRRMSAMWPQGTVHAFEPVPPLFARLAQNTAHCSNVVCHPFAIGSAVGRATLNLSSGASDGSSSLLKPTGHLDTHPDIRFERSIDVDVVTLDEWAMRNDVMSVDFLWLDLQGAELAALRGAEHLLSQVRAIHTEVSLVNTYEDAPRYPLLRAWLAERGFHVEKEALPWPDMGNVLFVRNAKRSHTEPAS